MRRQGTPAGQRQPRGSATGGRALGEAIASRIDQLATISDEPGRLTRIYLSPAHRQAAELVAAWMREAGMSVRIDATSTVIGRYEAASPNAPALLLGSHIDTVRNAGRFDGTLGVLTALAVVQQLHDAGRRLPFAIEVLAFGDEEGVRYPGTLTGSRALAGRFDAKVLDEVDRDGIARRDALARFGCDVTQIAAAVRDPAGVLGFVEVHIEQGPVLEAEDLPVAVVTSISGATRGRVTVSSESGHAGTVPMPLRRDALAAAAEMVLAVERRAAAEPELVGTVGTIEVAGGAPNVVAGTVSFSLDVRSPSDACRETAVADLARQFQAIASRRSVDLKTAFTYQAASAGCDAGLVAALARAIEGCGVAVRTLPSGAGHDAMSFKDCMPFAMLFVRCRGGVSHNPAEHVSIEDMDVAARVLIDFVEAFEPVRG